MYTGSCLCGGVKFEINGELEPIQMCHCSQCRKAQGTAFVTNIPVQEQNFRLLSGEPLLSYYESSPGKHRVFCKQCGSPVFSKTTALPGVIRIRAGTLDGELNTRPAFHFYTEFKANWFDINDDLPQYPTRPRVR
ncbi:MAG TPA: GFA family protein [Pseudomonadales bacterium]|nr:GFA family protein [Pseudomonadales bacterium]